MTVYSQADTIRDLTKLITSLERVAHEGLPPELAMSLLECLIQIRGGIELSQKINRHLTVVA